MNRSARLASFFLMLPCLAFAQRRDPGYLVEGRPAAVSTYESGLRGSLSEASRRLPTLSPNDPAVLQLKTSNAIGREPHQIGVVRQIRPVLALRPSDFAKRTIDQRADWKVEVKSQSVTSATRIDVENAHRLRLHLRNLSLPAEAVFSVYAPGGSAMQFQLPAGTTDFWLPSVEGPSVIVEMNIPRASTAEARVEISDLIEVLRSEEIALISSIRTHGTSCLSDATCITASTLDVIEDYRTSVAHLERPSGRGLAVCSGALIIGGPEQAPVDYLLSANHCFSTQSDVTSIEAFWDFKTSTCGGTIPSMSSLPRSFGGLLVATSATTDFALIRLNSVPGHRILMGWDAGSNAAVAGTRLHRISHPVPETTIYSQVYSQSVVDTNRPACQGSPRPQFLYSNPVAGGLSAGSSGAPVIIEGGYVVGQLLGACAPAGTDNCDSRNVFVDGAFAQTYPQIVQFIDPPLGNCVQSATTICLNQDRFRVEVTWRTSNGTSGTGKAIRYTSDSGLFWFFNSENIEVLVKILNGCPVNNHYWAFAAATTNVEYTLRITDTRTGRRKEYFNPLNVSAQAVTDTEAFHSCP